MPRVIWKGAASFSLIHIPVALQTASREQSLSFDMLDRRDFAPVGSRNPDDLPQRIEAKVQAGKGKAITPAAEQASKLRTADVVDMGDLLRRSLADRKIGTAGPDRETAAVANRSRARRTTTRRRRRA